MTGEKYTVHFTVFDDGKIRISYQEVGKDGIQNITLPVTNQYNKMITGYLEKCKVFL
jgi:hypothetical protein